MEEKKTREEAETLLREWADYLELDTDRGLYNDIVEELRGPVRRDRLTFDIDTEVFRYVLIKSVDSIEIVEIKETDFNEKKTLQKYKESENMDAAAMLMSKHTNLNTEQVLKLKTRDQVRINAVVMGFLSQTAPGRES